MRTAVMALLLLAGAAGWATELRHAKCFTVERKDGYKLVEVANAWKGCGDTFTYALVPRGAKAPEGLPPKTMVVEVPVRNVALLSTTDVGFMESLGLLDKIAGGSNLELVNSAALRARIARKQVVEVGGGSSAGDTVNMEKLYALRPELVMTYAYGTPSFDSYPKLTEAGFKVVLSASYMEPTPLGRAEWVKFAALFFGREAEAEAAFAKVERGYLATKAKAAAAKTRPAVFCNIAFKGSWYMSGGGGFLAALLADANADYLWKDVKGDGSAALSFEAVLAKAANADFWVNVGSCKSRRELLGQDNRHSLFKAFRDGQVYNCDAKTSPGGGNDFFELGVARPDLILADLAAIFHPELFPDHPTLFYRKLPE